MSAAKHPGSPTKPSQASTTPVKPVVVATPPKNPATPTKSLFQKNDAAPTVEEVKYLTVPDVDLEMPSWSMTTVKAKPGDNLKIRITIRSHAMKPISGNFQIRAAGDAFFQTTSKVITQTFKPNEDVIIDFDLKPNGGTTNLNNLPPHKEIKLLKDTPGGLAMINTIAIIIPINIYVRYLKEEYAPIRLLLWGLFGTGKSSFINSLATLYNEDPKNPNRKVNIAKTKPSNTTCTTELKTFEVDNVTIQDSWGWESQRKELYSPLLFQCMLSGMLGDTFSMSNASTLNVTNLPSVAEKKPVDVVLLFVTHNSLSNADYLAQMRAMIAEAEKLKIAYLILLTQIDRVDPALKENPYQTNEAIAELLFEVRERVGEDEQYIVPVVNYTSQPERNWPMDRAAVVSLLRAFQVRDDKQAY